jgi:hypothetical protein
MASIPLNRFAVSVPSKWSQLITDWSHQNEVVCAWWRTRNVKTEITQLSAQVTTTVLPAGHS